MKVSAVPADGPFVVMLQPIVIALNIIIILWALRTMETLDAADIHSIDDRL